jgi:hypothetical protein
MKWLFGLIILTLAAPAAAATITQLHPELGHVLLLNDEVQAYVRTDPQSAIFTAVLPTGWSYLILIDGDQNGVWGEGPVTPRDRTLSPLSPDFAYASSHGTFCSQYIYEAYKEDPDKVSGSSFCGVRTSAATFRVDTVSDGVSLQTFTIPRSELRNGPGEVRFAIEIWNGSGTFVFGSPSAPYILTLGAN